MSTQGAVVPLDRPVYQVNEAARLLRLPDKTLRRWLDGDRRFDRVILNTEDTPLPSHTIRLKLFVGKQSADCVLFPHPMSRPAINIIPHPRNNQAYRNILHTVKFAIETSLMGSSASLSAAKDSHRPPLSPNFLRRKSKTPDMTAKALRNWPVKTKYPKVTPI